MIQSFSIFPYHLATVKIDFTKYKYEVYKCETSNTTKIIIEKRNGLGLALPKKNRHSYFGKCML